ncbi:DUF637 domain-containing protein [Orbaceae bacterium ESL0727]|nr:DUF637 domain-containing protein [Orbaceae bacterium ESL0727]
MDIENKTTKLMGYLLVSLTVMQPLQPLMAAGITIKDNNIKVQNNGSVPVINIVKPNQSGVSHNQFVDFNVTDKGAVLNNATSAGTSQLAGQIQGNANLQGNSAKLIINEVTGDGRSELKGKVEVFGKQADVLIANPNGITCDGCGFINTNRATITTGKPTLDKNGAIQALTTTKGTIVIGEQGMDTSNVHYTDIISRATEINGQIKAQNLNVIQGSNKMDYTTGNVTQITGEGTKPTVSIDTKALGGMYAGKIHLVSTENGVGVNLNNIVSTQNNIVLATDGKLQLGNVQSKTDLDITAKNIEIAVNKTVSSGGTATLAADLLANNQGKITTAKDLRIYANDVKNVRGTIEANNNLWIQKDIKDTRSRSVENISGTIKTNTGNLLIRADNMVNRTYLNMAIEAIKANSATSTPISQYTHNNVTFITNISFRNEMGINTWFGTATPSLTDTNKNLLNAYRNRYIFNKDIQDGVITSGKDLYINSDKLTNENGKIKANANIFLTGGSLFLKNSFEGIENIWYRYDILKPVNNENKYKYYYPEEPRTIYNTWQASKLDEQKTLNISAEKGASITAGGNLIADFKNDIILSNTNSDQYQFITNIADRSTAMSAQKNIALSAANIELQNKLNAQGDISLLATNNIKLENNQLNAGKNIDLVATNDIKLSQSQLVANNISLISRTGNINLITADKIHYLDQYGDQIFGKLDSKNKLELTAGKNIAITDQEISVGKDFSVITGGTFTLKNSNQLLEKNNDLTHDTPSQKEKQNYFDKIFNKTNIINVGENIILQAGKSIELDGMTLSAGKETDITAGEDVILVPRMLEKELRKQYFPSQNEAKLSDIITACGNILINAGRDIYSKAATISSSHGNIDIIAGRNFLLPAVAYTFWEDIIAKRKWRNGKLKVTMSTITHNTHVVTHVNAANKINATVGGELIANGAEFTAGNDLFITSKGKMEFNAVENSDETHLGRTRSGSTMQQNVVLASGGNLNLLTDSSILFQATDLDAEKSIKAAAKGGFLFAEAMQESSYYEKITKKRNWYGKSKKVRTFTSSTTNKVVDFTANDNVELLSSGDSTYQASQIQAGQDITLSSTNGKVIFEGVNDTAFKQKTVMSKGFYVKYSDKGYEQNTWRLPTVQAGGQFTVNAAQGINADVITKGNQSLDNALTLLGNTEGTQWLKDLNKQGNVEWSKVQNAYNSWHHETKSLNPVVAAVIAVAVAVATSGSSLAAAAGNSMATGTAAGTTTNAIMYGVGSQGMSALVSKAAVSLVENGGNLSNTLKSLGSNDSVKSIITSMVVGGAMGGFDKYLGATSEALKNGEKLLLSSNASWNQIAQSVVGHSVIDAGVNAAINGGSFKDRFATALLSNIGNQVNAESAHLIGQNGQVIGLPGKFISHAATSAIAAEIGGGNGIGAAAGALAAELAVTSMGDYFISRNYSNEQIIGVSKVAGAIAGAIATNSPQGVYSAANAAHIVVENNYLGKAAVKAAEAKCDGNLICQQQAINDFVQGYNDNIQQGAIIQTGIIAGTLSMFILPESTITGGVINGSINAGVQYIMNDDGSINWTNVGISTGVGAITGGIGTGFWGTVGWNAAGGATSNYLEGKDPLMGAAISSISSGVGYIGGKWLEGSLQKIFNPIAKQYEWVPVGIWSITKPASNSSIPSVTGNAFNSGLSEITQEGIKYYIKGEKNENK